MEIQAVSPLSPARTKVCLALFVNRQIARAERGGRYRLVRPGLTRDLRQRQMADYAEARSCRWATLLNFFGSDELAGGRCGRCDNCPAPNATVR